MDERREKGSGTLSAAEKVPDPFSPDREIGLRGLALFVGGLVGTLALAFVAMALLARGLRSDAARRDPPPPPLEHPLVPPPPPLLQTSLQRELARLRAAEEERLRGWGWVDRARGIARIPLERAEELALEQGLPVWGGSGR